MHGASALTHSADELVIDASCGTRGRVTRQHAACDLFHLPPARMATCVQTGLLLATSDTAVQARLPAKGYHFAIGWLLSIHNLACSSSLAAADQRPVPTAFSAPRSPRPPMTILSSVCSAGIGPPLQ